jgi:hypothetical protein
VTRNVDAICVGGFRRVTRNVMKNHHARPRGKEGANKQRCIDIIDELPINKHLSFSAFSHP